MYYSISIFLYVSLFILLFSGTMQDDKANVLAFPGAEGFGQYASGGRGGAVYIVDNLNDSGPGSFREAIQKKHPRMIVFAVTGEIKLKSTIFINNGDLTIAGQSAPGDGITIRDYPVKIKAGNVIVRYMRFRLGDLYEQEDDALSCIGTSNVIIDHCSMSWGTDECGSFYDNEDFTLQWSIVSESLNASVHAKGEHGYGGICGGMNATFHHNLLANHNSRNPRFHGARYHKMPEKELVDFRNNVIYNWRGNSSYGGEEGKHNLVNNFYKAGPATHSNRNRILEPYKPLGSFYVDGNEVAGFDEVSANNSLGVKQAQEVLVPSAFEVAKVNTHLSAQAFDLVLGYSGASKVRDAVDQRVVDEVKNGNSSFGKKGDGIIDSQEEAGGWPVLAQGSPHKDSDRDGMPDAWELAQGLDPNDAADGNKTTLNPGYTNLEVYLNSLVDFPK